MSEDYRGLTLNSLDDNPTVPPFLGTIEKKNFKVIIDAIIGDTVYPTAIASGTNPNEVAVSHKHLSLYDDVGVKIIEGKYNVGESHTRTPLTSATQNGIRYAVGALGTGVVRTTYPVTHLEDCIIMPAAATNNICYLEGFNGYWGGWGYMMICDSSEYAIYGSARQYFEIIKYNGIQMLYAIGDDNTEGIFVDLMVAEPISGNSARVWIQNNDSISHTVLYSVHFARMS